jgi:hypothetical protein
VRDPSLKAITANRQAEIRLEEIYRQEIRASLESDTASRSYLWRFLNSTFGIWLLSAIFISAAGAVYTAWRQASAAEQSRQARIERLDTEISYRLARVLGASREMLSLIKEHDIKADQLESDKDARELAANYHIELDATRVLSPERRKAVEIEEKELRSQILSMPIPFSLLTRAPGDQYLPLHDGFRNQALPNLIVELRKDVPQEERVELDRVLGRITDPSFDPSLNRVLRQADYICPLAIQVIDDVVLPRWKLPPFEYVRCPSGNPFCRQYIDEQGKSHILTDVSCHTETEQERKLREGGELFQ